MNYNRGSTLIEICIATALFFFMVVSTLKLMQNLNGNHADLQQKQIALNALKQAHEYLQVCLHDPTDDIHQQLKAISFELKHYLEQGEFVVIQKSQQISPTLVILWKGTKPGYCNHQSGHTCLSIAIPNAKHCFADLL